MNEVTEIEPRKNYSDLLRDPRWQQKRLKVMERDEWKCLDCGSTTKTLNVHHHQYTKGKKPWEYRNGDLGTYCHECHEARHKQLNHLKTALDCFTRQLTWRQIENLHRAFMFKGRPLKILMAIAKGRTDE